MSTPTGRIEWDKNGERWFENGISHVALYVANDAATSEDDAYLAPVAWNGITSISENREGAEANEIWADNIKYAVLRGKETLSLGINAYMSPKEFDACDGEKSLIPGMVIGQQKRKKFGLAYRTEKGNDNNPEAGYCITIVYGCTAAPSERSHETINDSPDAMELSWDVDCTPVTYKDGDNDVSVYSVTFDSILLGAAKMAALEDLLFGHTSSGSGSDTTSDGALKSIATIKSTLAAVTGT